MQTFSDYILSEELITFNKQAYPKFGNVVIMAGGAGSGKGFVLSKLIGMEGFKFDVDELKLLAVKTPSIIKKVKDEFDFDLTNLDTSKNPLALKDPNNVFKLHTIIGDSLNLDNKKKSTMFASVLSAAPDRKPNLIFDVTLKSLSQLEKTTRPLEMLGYDKQNIHIVWVVNDIEVAKAQNQKRDRTVPVEILVNTHRGAAQTMGDIIKMGTDLRKYMDGDIIFAFNKVNVDSELGVSDKGGSYVQRANYFYVKRAGKPVDREKLDADLKAKIAKYVPKNIDWNDI